MRVAREVVSEPPVPAGSATATSQSHRRGSFHKDSLFKVIKCEVFGAWNDQGTTFHMSLLPTPPQFSHRAGLI